MFIKEAGMRMSDIGNRRLLGIDSGLRPSTWIIILVIVCTYCTFLDYMLAT